MSRNKNKTDQMTIIFIGFDGYSDIWGDCFKLFNKYWPDCPYNVLFVNNVKEAEFDNVTTIHAGEDAEWSRKVQIGLENCDSPYVCLLLEDFFIGKPILSKDIERVLNVIRSNSISYYKLANMSRAVKNHDPVYKGIKYLHIIPESDEYGISLQAAIWSRDFLKEKLGTENYNAWKFEFDRVKETEEDSNLPRVGCVFDDRNILQLKHGVVQSKLIPGTVKYFRRTGNPLNINREVLSYLEYNMIQFQSLMKYTLPKRLRRPVKKMMERVGMKFVSTTRDK